MNAEISEIRFDEALMVEYSREGDLDAFNQLVLAYQDTAYNAAYRILGERNSAEDVVQNAFLSAYRKLNTFRDGSFKAWLLRIVTNACYDEIRRQKRRPSIPLNPTDWYDEEIESPYWLEDPGDMPEETALIGELNSAIQHALFALHPDFRIVVILVDIMDMNYTEAASAAGIPLGTVKSRLRRARLQLQNQLKEYANRIPIAPIS